jgi:hypothetical protein
MGSEKATALSRQTNDGNSLPDRLPSGLPRDRDGLFRPFNEFGDLSVEPRARLTQDGREAAKRQAWIAYTSFPAILGFFLAMAGVWFLATAAFVVAGAIAFLGWRISRGKETRTHERP